MDKTMYIHQLFAKCRLSNFNVISANCRSHSISLNVHLRSSQTVENKDISPHTIACMLMLAVAGGLKVVADVEKATQNGLNQLEECCVVPASLGVTVNVRVRQRHGGVTRVNKRTRFCRVFCVCLVCLTVQIHYYFNLYSCLTRCGHCWQHT